MIFMLTHEQDGQGCSNSDGWEETTIGQQDGCGDLQDVG